MVVVVVAAEVAALGKLARPEAPSDWPMHDNISRAGLLAEVCVPSQPKDLPPYHPPTSSSVRSLARSLAFFNPLPPSSSSPFHDASYHSLPLPFLPASHLQLPSSRSTLPFLPSLSPLFLLHPSLPSLPSFLLPPHLGREDEHAGSVVLSVYRVLGKGMRRPAR